MLRFYRKALPMLDIFLVFSPIVWLSPRKHLRWVAQGSSHKGTRAWRSCNLPHRRPLLNSSASFFQKGEETRRGSRTASARLD